MKFFVDTADTNDIRELAETGLLDGVTTNPSLIHKAGRDFLDVVKEICGIVSGPVSAEVVALDHETMMKEAEVLRKIADNVAVKVPLTLDGLKTCRKLTNDGTMVNVTLCFSANQALLAAKAGATFISPFVGRHDDVGFDGMQLISDIAHLGLMDESEIELDAAALEIAALDQPEAELQDYIELLGDMTERLLALAVVAHTPIEQAGRSPLWLLASFALKVTGLPTTIQRMPI